MKCLLIGGAPSVGKSESIYRLTKYLQSIGFIDIYNLVPLQFTDFRAILEGKDNTGNQIRIIINTATDNEIIIQYFKEFYDNNGSYDILISSIRDNEFWPRNAFFNIMNLNSEFLLEIPLAKITRRGTNFNSAFTWYCEQIDKLLIHTLNNKPFEI